MYTIISWYLSYYTVKRTTLKQTVLSLGHIEEEIDGASKDYCEESNTQ
jgi:hypothetical protein